MAGFGLCGVPGLLSTIVLLTVYALQGLDAEFIGLCTGPLLEVTGDHLGHSSSLVLFCFCVFFFSSSPHRDYGLELSEFMININVLGFWVAFFETFLLLGFSSVPVVPILSSWYVLVYC